MRFLGVVFVSEGVWFMGFSFGMALRCGRVGVVPDGKVRATRDRADL